MNLGEYLGAGAATTKLLLHLNGNSIDDSGNGNNGADNSISYSKNYGKFNEGAVFIGNSGNSYIKILTSDSIRTPVLTISVWIKRGDINREQCISMYDNGLQSGVAAYYFALHSNNKIWFQQQNGYNTLNLFSNGTIADTTMYHNIVVTRSYITGETAFYIDGKLDVLYTSNTVQFYYGTTKQHLTIGAYRYGSGNTLVSYLGNIDEYIMEGRIWTPKEVQIYYTESLGMFAIL